MRRALEAAIAPFRREPLHWEEVEPTLEDVFIRLMAEAPGDRLAKMALFFDHIVAYTLDAGERWLDLIREDKAD